jgi:DNA-dependent RNA polymerase auxiliary subunit epsilon
MSRGKRRGVIYTRHASNTSVKTQERECREYARQNKIKVIHVYRQKMHMRPHSMKRYLLGMCAYCLQNNIKWILINSREDVDNDSVAGFLVRKLLSDCKMNLLFTREISKPKINYENKKLTAS